MAPRRPRATGARATAPFDPRRFDPMARGLVLDDPPTARGVPLDEVLDPGRLGDALAEHRRAHGHQAPVPAASAWMNRAVGILLPGLLAAWSLDDAGIDASPGNLELLLEGATPAACRIVDPERVARGPAARDRTLDTALGDTLAPLIQAADEAAGLPPAIPWTIAGNLVAYVYDTLAREHPELDLAQDRARLLDAPRAAWTDRENPLAGTVRYETAADGEARRVREVCCRKRELDGQDACTSCPVRAAQRAREGPG